MSKFNIFFTVFIIACIASVIFVIFYLQSLFSLAVNSQHFGVHDTPDFFYFFNQQIIISGIVMLVTNLAYRVLGIFYISKITTLTNVEKTVWSVGFLFFGFTVAIVFLLIAKNRKFLE